MDTYNDGLYLSRIYLVHLWQAATLDRSLRDSARPEQCYKLQEAMQTGDNHPISIVEWVEDICNHSESHIVQ